MLYKLAVLLLSVLAVRADEEKDKARRTPPAPCLCLA